MRFEFIVLLFITISSYSQSKEQKKLEKKFQNEFCECLEKDESASPEKMFNKTYEVCINFFFTMNGDEFMVLVKQRDWGDKSSLSDYDKGSIIGKEIFFNVVDDLVKHCKVYRSTLLAYKEDIFNKMKMKGVSTKTIVSFVNSMIEGVSDPQVKAQFTTQLALIYEMSGDKKEALKAYEKSLEIYPTSTAKGLKALLKRK